MSNPLVTVVVTPREGHFMWEKSLASVLKDDLIPFDLIYVDLASPPEIEKAIRAQGVAGNFQVLRHDDWVAPSVARKRAIAQVKTKYVACVDNDVLVERGCLQKLVSCAEETGAGLVCPLYLQEGGGKKQTIHMAGGKFLWSDDGKSPRLLAERDRLGGADLRNAAGLVREKVDFTEYHYVLGRMDLLSRPGAISDDILLVHEHLDLALFARAQGMDVMFEPSARARYVAFNSRPLMDLEFYRKRWDVEGCRQSLTAFAEKWLTPDNLEVVDSMASFAEGRLQTVELHRMGPASADLSLPMGPGELAQTRSDLREQAFGRRYPERAVRMIDHACDVATVMFDGLYRPDGRPFLNHVLGTASALVRYELSARTVCAGLLHAAITHRPDWMKDAAHARALGAADRELIIAQKNVVSFLERENSDLSQLTINGAAVVCVLAANEADMALSGEYRSTGRPPRFSPLGSARIKEVLACFGIEGLAASMHSTEAGQPWPLFGGTPRTSFRLGNKEKLMSQIVGPGAGGRAIDKARPRD